MHLLLFPLWVPVPMLAAPMLAVSMKSAQAPNEVNLPLSLHESRASEVSSESGKSSLYTDAINHMLDLLNGQHEILMSVLNDIRTNRSFRKKVRKILERNQNASSKLNLQSMDISKLLKDAETEYSAINAEIESFVSRLGPQAASLRSNLKDRQKYGIEWISLDRLAESNHILAKNRDSSTQVSDLSMDSPVMHKSHILQNIKSKFETSTQSGDISGLTASSGFENLLKVEVPIEGPLQEVQAIVTKSSIKGTNITKAQYGYAVGGILAAMIYSYGLYLTMASESEAETDEAYRKDDEIRLGIHPIVKSA